ncbi:glycosyltransferase family 4 protein [Chloroflexota bacterium]
MKILLVVDNFYPELGSAAHVYYDLGRALVKRGHEVHVITMYPRRFYLPAENQGRPFPMDETIAGMQVHRCRFKFAYRENVLLRGLEHFLVPNLYFQRYKKLQLKFDGIILYVPPLPLYRMANRIRSYDGTRCVLNFQDIHPQELIDVGMAKNPLVIKFLEYLERRAYQTADFITVLSPAGVDLIVERGGNPDWIQHIYNSIDLEELEENLKKQDYKQLEGIEDKILVSYAGIINSFQGIDNILDVAKRFRADDNFIFYIVGDGMETKRLKKRIEDESINNVVMKPLQPKDVYFNIINSSDISIISLDSRMTAPCLPGKFANLLGAGQKIIASVPYVNDVAKIVTNNKCGIAVQPGNLPQFEQTIRTLMDGGKKTSYMRRNARRFLEKNMNLEMTSRRYEEIFTTLSNMGHTE